MPEVGQLATELGISFLAPGSVTIGNIRFIGATLWTDYALNGDARFAKMTAQAELNDHRMIRFAEGGRFARFTPSHAEMLHRRDLAFIVDRLAELHAGPTVVVTHHAPHPGSVAERYAGQPMAAAFASNLGAVIEQISRSFGFTATTTDPTIIWSARTRVLANQAGYPTHFGARENPQFNPELVVEV